jgi:hypothetical protein
MCVFCLQKSAWVFEQQLSCEYLFSNLKIEHLVSIVIAIFPAVNVSVQWMTKEGGPGLYAPIGFDLVYNSAKFSVLQINFAIAVEKLVLCSSCEFVPL